MCYYDAGLDGNTSSMERDKMITYFNSAENTQCWLFLISTKSVSREGLNKREGLCKVEIKGRVQNFLLGRGVSCQKLYLNFCFHS